MNDLEKFDTIRQINHVIIVFKEIILRQNVNQKTRFKNDCSAKHHTTLQDYSTSNQRNRSKKGRKEDSKQN